MRIQRNDYWFDYGVHLHITLTCNSLPADGWLGQKP